MVAITLCLTPPPPCDVIAARSRTHPCVGVHEWVHQNSTSAHAFSIFFLNLEMSICCPLSACIMGIIVLHVESLSAASWIYKLRRTVKCQLTSKFGGAGWVPV